MKCPSPNNHKTMTSKIQLEPLQITHINTITFISIASEGNFLVQKLNNKTDKPQKCFSKRPQQ